MLVLTRKTHESIIIGDHIEVKIIGVRGDKVQLGIEAPKNIPVHRQEVYKAIQRKKAKQEKAGQNSKQKTVMP